MTDSLAGKRILVTAAAAGIGRRIAERFHAAGAQLHLCDSDAEQLATTRDSMAGVRATPCDVADAAQVDTVFDEIGISLGGLDILINNAGIAGPTAPVEEIAPRDWARTVAVDLNGAFHCCRRAVPLLRQAGGGVIINMASVGAAQGYPFRSPYAAAKWGLIGLTKTLAMELGPDNIRVNAISPGPVEGERLEQVLADHAEIDDIPIEEARERLRKVSSLRTFVTADEVAEAVLYLCSPAARHISGQMLGIDGNVESMRY